MTSSVLRFKTREDWLKARNEGIGASEVAAILGLNPFTTAYQLWRAKTGRAQRGEENFAMRAGHYLEDAVAHFWSDATGNQIIKNSVGDWMYVSAEKPFLRVSPDRTFWLKGLPKSKWNKGIFEAKTTQRTIDPDNIPMHWFVQVQMNLGVSGLEYGSIGWLTQGREFGYKDIIFDRQYFEFLSEEVERFWVDNILGDKEPPLATAEDVLTKYRKETAGKTAEATETIYNAYEELKAIRDEISALDERKSALEDKLKVAIDDAEAITYNGKVLATWKAPKSKEKFDVERFRNAQPELYTQYLKTPEAARRFLLR